MPAARKLKLEADLTKAGDQKAISTQKLNDAKQRLKSADMNLQKRLVHRGIRWRRAKLEAARNSHKESKQQLHLLRVSTRHAREKLHMKRRLVEHEVSKKEKQLAAAKASLAALSSIKGMED